MKNSKSLNLLFVKVVTLFCLSMYGLLVMGQSFASSNAITLDRVLHNIDSLYDYHAFYDYLDESFISTKNKITNYYESLPAFDDKNKVFKHYYDNIIIASETEGQNTSLLRNAIIYLMLPTEKDRETAYQAAAIAYADSGDKDNLQKLIDDFSAYSKLNGDAYSEVIKQMQDSYQEVLNQVPFTEHIKGTWVMTVDPRPSDYLHFPFSIIDINDVTKNYGIKMRNFPGQDFRYQDIKMNKLLYSQLIAGHNGYLEASFGSEHLNIGNDEFAQSGFQATRELRADMAAEISTSNTSFGNKMLATAATGVVSGLLDALFSSTAESSTRVETMNLSLNQVGPDVLQGNLTYYDYKVNVSNMNSYRPTPTYNTQTEYVRWTKEDSVYFVDWKGRAYSLGSTYELDLKERDEIKKKYSWKRPKYLLPIIGGEIACAGIVTLGVLQIINCDKKDEEGNYIYNEYGAKEIDDGKLLLGVITAVIGEIGMIATPSIIISSRKSARKKAYGELNLKQIRKLRQKASTLSLSPVIQGTSQHDLSIGLQAGIKF